MCIFVFIIILEIESTMQKLHAEPEHKMIATSHLPRHYQNDLHKFLGPQKGTVDLIV